MLTLQSRTPVGELSGHIGARVRVGGLVQAARDQKRMQFLVLADASGEAQIVHDKSVGDDSLADQIASLTPGSAIAVTGATNAYTVTITNLAGGTLEGGGLFSMQVEGGQTHRTGLHIEISGTEGVLRITNPLAFQNKQDNAIEGMNGAARTFAPLPIPDQYETLTNTGLDVSALDLAYLYAAYASDKSNCTFEASNFQDAVRQHRLIDEIYRTSEDFFG